MRVNTLETGDRGGTGERESTVGGGREADGSPSQRLERLGNAQGQTE